MFIPCQNYNYNTTLLYIIYITGWIKPIINDATKYPIHDNTFKIRTDSVSGTVHIGLYTSSNWWITFITWWFYDWSYAISFCVPNEIQAKFTTVPPPETNKIWEVTASPVELKIKCNGVEVLHFVYSNKYQNSCSSRVKGWKISKVAFIRIANAATKMFYLHGKFCYIVIYACRL